MFACTVVMLWVGVTFMLHVSLEFNVHSGFKDLVCGLGFDCGFAVVWLDCGG